MIICLWGEDMWWLEEGQGEEEVKRNNLRKRKFQEKEGVSRERGSFKAEKLAYVGKIQNT